MAKLLVCTLFCTILILVGAFPLEDNDNSDPAKVTPLVAAEEQQKQTDTDGKQNTTDNSDPVPSNSSESIEQTYIEETYIEILLPGTPKLNTSDLEALFNKTSNATDDEISKRSADDEGSDPYKEISLKAVPSPTSGSTVPSVLYSLRNKESSTPSSVRSKRDSSSSEEDSSEEKSKGNKSSLKDSNEEKNNTSLTKSSSSLLRKKHDSSSSEEDSSEKKSKKGRSKSQDSNEENDKSSSDEDSLEKNFNSQTSSKSRSVRAAAENKNHGPPRAKLPSSKNPPTNGSSRPPSAQLKRNRREVVDSSEEEVSSKTTEGSVVYITPISRVTKDTEASSKIPGVITDSAKLNS